MRSIERRLDRLEEKILVPDCGHKMVFLRDSMEEEIEKVRKEIDGCSQCSKGDKPLIVIFKSFGKVEEDPKPDEVMETVGINANEAERSWPKIRFRNFT